MVHTFDRHLEEANRFIKSLAEELGRPGDFDHAARVTRAVFRTLRQRIVPEESMHLISQLPLILKGMYVDGWDISRPLSNARNMYEFMEEVRANTDRAADYDFGDENAVEKIRAVFTVLRQYVSEGEMNHVKHELPQEIAEEIM